MAKSITNVTIKSNKDEYSKTLDEVAEKVLDMWGSQAEKFAKENCPVDTGLLRNSITYAVAGNSPAIGAYKDNDGKQSGSYTGQAHADKGGPRHVYIGTNVEYAQRQEVGSFDHKIGRSPYLRPAIDEHMDFYRNILEQELKGG